MAIQITKLGQFYLDLPDKERQRMQKRAMAKSAIVTPTDDAQVLRLHLNDCEQTALIDAEDYPLIEKYKWLIHLSGDRSTNYINCSDVDGRRNYLYLHRFIMMAGPSFVVDHINGDTLDNRKANLRCCLTMQNTWNAKGKGGILGIKGVHRQGNSFTGCVKADGEKYQKCFKTIGQAEQWVRNKRVELHGEFARHA